MSSEPSNCEKNNIEKENFKIEIKHLHDLGDMVDLK